MKKAGFPLTSLGLSQFSRTKHHFPTLRKSLGFIIVILGVAGLTLLSLAPAWAGDGALDPSFNPGDGVQKIPIIRGQADYLDSTTGNANGVSLIFGYFTSVTDSVTTYTRSSIARLLDTSGTVDTNFNNSTNSVIPIVGEVRGAFLLNPKSSTSKIIIWGQFSLTSGLTTYYNLARLKWDTTAYVVDTDFPHIFNLVDTREGIPVSVVNTVAVQASTGNVLVGGYNMQVQGDTSHAYHLIRLTSAWAYDSAYSTANPARALPGGVVSGINLWDANFLNQARIFGTLPKSGGGNDYMELLDTDLSSILKSLGDITGIGQLDGPFYGMAQSAADQPWVIWGNFKQVFGTAINRVAVLKSDLSGLDNTTAPYASFNSGIIGGGGPDYSVFQGLMQEGGKVVLAGSLTSFNGTTCGRLVRLNTDGTVDTTGFNVGGIGLDDRPFRLYQPTGTSYLQIDGAFRNYNTGPGTARGGIATLDSNGVLQPSYANVTANSDTPGTVIALEGTGDGSIIIGGDFTGVGGKFHQSLARLNWDGSTDHSFVSNVDGVVNSLRLRDDKLLLAGHFGMAFGVGRTSLARLNTDYSLDNSFNPKVTKADGTLAGIRMADVDGSGLIIIGGHFDTINGSASTAVARLLSTGALDTSFTFTTPSGLSYIRVNAGGKMGDMYAIVGKATYDSEPRGFGCRLQYDGQLDTSFAIGQSPVDNVALFNGEVMNGGALNDGRIFLCGKFTSINDGSSFSIPRGYIARFTANGLLDTTWAPVGADNVIYSLNIQPNGKILIGGAFTQYNGIACNALARLNPTGSLDTTFNAVGSGPDGPVVVVSWWGNPRAFIGGAFTTYNGVSRPGIARILSIGISSTPPINYLLLN